MQELNKKIVILHPVIWLQSQGGAEQQIRYLINYLITQKYDVHYIFENQNDEFNHNVNFKVHPLTKIKINKRFGNRWFLYKKEIFKLLNEIKPDFIYTRFYSSWVGFASKYSLTNNCKHLLAIASDNDLTENKIKITKIFDFIERKHVYFALKNSKYIFTQNNFQQQQLGLKFNRIGHLLSQSTEPCDEEIIKNLNLTILWIGNLKKIKQPEIFFDIIKQFDSTLNINFKIIGRIGEYKSLIENCDKINNFQYLGELTNEEVNYQLSQSHILINTSLYEGFSNTFVQAWMRKVIVISLNVDPDNIISSNEIGFVNNSIADITKFIIKLYNNRTELEKMGEKAFNYARNKHSIANYMREINKFLIQ